MLIIISLINKQFENIGMLTRMNTNLIRINKRVHRNSDSLILILDHDIFENLIWT
jgi:hypothetical protein